MKEGRAERAQWLSLKNRVHLARRPKHDQYDVSSLVGAGPRWVGCMEEAPLCADDLYTKKGTGLKRAQRTVGF